MKCERLIVITGMSCQGKTHIATELNKKCGWYVIHTDWFYHPISKEGLKTPVGEEDERKDKLIREQRRLLTKTTVIEGSHIGNTNELEIFKRELGFKGKVYLFKVDSDKHLEYFATKHKVDTEKEYEHIKKWFNSIYDWKIAHLISDAQEILSFVDIDDVCIPR